MIRIPILILCCFVLPFSAHCAEEFEYRASGFELHKVPKDTAPRMCAPSTQSTDIWHLTNMSVFRNIALQLGEKIPSDGRFNMQTIRSVKSKLENRFKDKKLDCLLTIKPSGKLVKIEITSSSQSDELDQFALALIRKAAPFEKNESKKDMWCQVSFPNIGPNIIWH